MPDEVIELSVDETNQLRAKLGLPPLRVSKPPSEEKVLELSVENSNALRQRLGLAPLRDTKEKEIHAPAPKEGKNEAAERIAQARLKRQVQQGFEQLQGPTLGDDASDWVQRMKQVKEQPAKQKKAKKQKAQDYTDKDLEGMQVAHAVGDLGDTTVLTLADAPLLQVDDKVANKVVGINEEDTRLVNVNLAEQEQQRDGLRKKRELEMGMGRAGGYAGFDDDEFEELGGTQTAQHLARGGHRGEGSKLRGFQIGVHRNGNDDDEEDTAGGKRKAISLVSEQPNAAVSDYMTVEEEEAERARKKKKEAKFKKKKKKDKKEKHRRTERVDDEPEEEETGGGMSLLAELQAKARKTGAQGLRKRARGEGDDDDDDDGVAKPMEVDDSAQEKRAKYEAAMAKGNERTSKAFAVAVKAKAVESDEEDDDAFLNAALSKARRLNQLKSMSNQLKGADAVVEAVKSSAAVGTDSVKPENTISFKVDDTREFTRALQAREELRSREKKSMATKRQRDAMVVSTKQPDAVASSSVEAVETVEDVDMEELAKEVKIEPSEAFGTEEGQSETVGKGLGSILGLLKKSGELSRKKTGREELRGRARDERNYQNYEPIDLKSVVKIDARTASAKDIELANREVNLEYRDEHGRLLTEKEAFRELSYQFHGKGMGKRKQEKKRQQIAREQAETRIAAQQGSDNGILGALRKTQQATGKAFVVHKT